MHEALIRIMVLPRLVGPHRKRQTQRLVHREGVEQNVEPKTERVGASFVARTLRRDDTCLHAAIRHENKAATDRAEDPTAIAPTKSGQDLNLNVTQDVELWYTGAAPNYGWMFTNEDEIDFRLNPPAHTTRGTWILRITYEPR